MARPYAPRMGTASKAAWGQLLDLLRDAGDRWIGPEWGITSESDHPEGVRVLSHILQSALYSHQEADPERPAFRRIVSPTRSFTGDNADAIYFEAPVAGDGEYVVRGNLAGAVYTSFTLEAGGHDGSYPTGLAGVLNDTQIDVGPDGDYEIRLGGAPAERNWIGLPADGGRITTRHYFELPESAAASQTFHVPLSIRSTRDVPPPPRWDDERVAAAIQRVVNHVRTKTVDGVRPGQILPSWLSQVPNVFNAPEKPGTLALAAADAAYAMAPFVIGPDQALVIEGRWPDCRFGNLCLWNRFSQMFDYVNRPVSRNRANTTLLTDGSFRMIVAHRDPGLPNWLDSEGRAFGTMFWRFFLPEGDIVTPRCTVVDHSELHARYG